MNNNWIVQLEEDKATGELLLPFPPDLLSQMGWSEGTDLSWIVNDNGTVSIKEKEKSSDDDNSTAG
jgi:hypothetical protein